MGWMSNKWAETSARVEAAVIPHLGGEELLGCVHAMRQSKMSAKQFAIGITPERLVIVEVDRKLKATNDAPVVLRPSEISVGNIFSDGAFFTLGRRDQEIRFTARGEEHRFAVIGGNVVENAMAGDEQLDGLTVLVEFLRRCPA